MKIGIDVRYISHGLTGGVRTYVHHLARELPLAAPNHTFIYYADRKASFEIAELPENVVVRLMPWRSALSTLGNDRSIRQWMARDDVDVAHFPGNYGPRTSCPLVVTVHDALNLFPMSQHLRGFSARPRKVALMAYLGYKTRKALAYADTVITVSEHARLAIAQQSGCAVERIVRIYEAADDQFRVIEDAGALEALRRTHGLQKPFVLADGVKNPSAAIEAFRGLPPHLREAFDLLFFSRENTPRPEVAFALDGGSVRFISRPPTPELVGLMNMATVFLFPSWYEGFGIPLVEAMRCGTPIVASSRAAIPEIVGDAGVCADLEAPGGLARQLNALLSSSALRNRFRDHALERARMFCWRNAARQTVDVYERIGATRAR